MQIHPTSHASLSGWVLCASIAALAAPTLGDFSDDPTMPLAVGDRTGEQAQAKVAPTTDGGCYISWFDNSAGGYDVYLQRLDASGNEMWAHNGILIADRGFSSTQDYDLTTDGTDHALLVFRDDRFGGTRITAQRVQPDGTQQWGSGNGVQFGDGVAFVAAPKIAATTDGEYVIAWTNDTESHMERLDSTGATVWASTVVLSGAGNVSVSDLAASDSGAVIGAFVEDAGLFSPRELRTQKFSAAGVAQWNSGSFVAVFDTGSIQLGNFPEFVVDDSGGAVFAWYDTADVILQVRAQRVDSTGSKLFGANGALVSTNVARERVSPWVAFDGGFDETFVAWSELDNNQGDSGLYAQRLSSSGGQIWGSEGTALTAVDGVQDQFVRILALGGGEAVISWMESTGFGMDLLKSVRVDDVGGAAWTTTVSTVSSGKSRPTMMRSASGYSILAWQDDRSDANNILAHNINDDGTIGRACPGDANGDNMVNFDDLNIVLEFWSQSVAPGTNGDVTGDGVVDFGDLNVVLEEWGGSC